MVFMVFIFLFYVFRRGYNSHGDLQQNIFLSGSGWFGQPEGEGTTLTVACSKIFLFLLARKKLINNKKLAFYLFHM